MDERHGDEIQNAALEAERLADAIRAQDGGLHRVYERLTIFITDIEAAGYHAEDLLPVDAEPGLGFSLRDKRDGKTLWQAIAYAARGSLCDSDSEVRKLLARGGSVGAGSLVTTILATLGLPLMAIPIAVAITAVILALGLEGFCDWISSARDEPQPA